MLFCIPATTQEKQLKRSLPESYPGLFPRVRFKRNREANIAKLLMPNLGRELINPPCAKALNVRFRGKAGTNRSCEKSPPLTLAVQKCEGMKVLDPAET
jgi:hypothetical protein